MSVTREHVLGLRPCIPTPGRSLSRLEFSVPALSATCPRAADPRLWRSDHEFHTHGGICPTAGRSVTTQGRAPRGTVYPGEPGGHLRLEPPSLLTGLSAWLPPTTTTRPTPAAPALADPLLHLTESKHGSCDRFR